MTSNQLEAEAESYQMKENFSKVPVMKITRTASVRFKRRKLSGGVDLKKQLKKSRSVKIPSLGSSRSSNKQVSQLRLTGISCAYDRVIYQCRFRRVVLDSDVRNLCQSQHRSGLSYCENSGRVVRRTPTLRSLRALRSRRSSMQEPTCSSTLKGSKFPDDLETQQGESASAVCSYSYCSLHGHRHASPPPLKRLISVRRRALKNQRGLKTEAQPSAKGEKLKAQRNLNLTMEEKKDDAVSDLHDMESCSFSSASVEHHEILSDSSSVGGAVVQPAASDEESYQVSEKDHMLAPGPNPEASKIRMENRSNFKLWNLVYQHLVPEAVRQPPPDGLKNQRGLQDTGKLGSSQDLSGNDHESNRKLELTESDAVKLVQQAFNMLLSEIPDDSSDDQSIAGETVSDENILLEERTEDKEVNIQASPDPAKHEEAQDVGLQVQRIDFPNTAQLPVKQESEKQMPKRWSNLKKLIILKRFVKELETVKNFHRQKGGNLAMQQHGPETERVHLRHQMVEGRKRADEWMLDYALRQVISTLAPSQKRKVDLLVQAFETVIPGMNMSRLSPVVSPHGSSVEATEYSIPYANEGIKVSHSEITVAKTEAPETGSMKHWDQASDSSTAKSTSESSINRRSDVQFGFVDTSTPVLSTGATGMMELKKEEESSLDAGNENDNFTRYVDNQLCSCNLSSLEPEEAPRPSDTGSISEDEAECTSSKQVPENGTLTNPFGTGISTGLSEIHSRHSGLNNSQDCKDLPHETEEHQGKPNNKVEIMPGNDKSEYGFCPSPPPAKNSELNSTPAVAVGNKLEKQRYTRLWYLLYKHMVSTSAKEKGNQLLAEEANTEEGGDGSVLKEGDDDILLNSSTADYDMMLKIHRADHHTLELQSEVIKLVEEAIDEIPLSETQDDQDAPEKERPEKNHIEGEGQVISETVLQNAVKDVPEEPNKREEGLTTAILGTRNNDATKDATAASNAANKHKSQGQKNWSNLKKLILIRRFVKSLEKVKAFNPRGPRLLPQGTAPEPEKVHLRPLGMEDRKNSDEWMLDHALQQVVAKLTPARKRRVELLVEAFETVVPTLGN